MTSRMTEARLTQDADSPNASPEIDGPRAQVLLTLVEGADLQAALAAVGRQVYEPSPSVVLIGWDEEGSLPEGVSSVSSLEEAIAAAPSEIDYLWLLHSDARPRPDALRALVFELERSEGGLAGSKLLVAGTENELESVGSATDVFGEPYSGIDEGEIDLQQYDVVREVAFVPSASMMVRRDLAQGLRGLDPLLPPVAAGLDFSQRIRLAGGRVITVPSSEVYHQGRCIEAERGWREQAGRLRSMLTAYTPLTLAWVVPFDLVVSFLDSLASLLLLRWRPAAAYLRSLAWNLLHLPSTVSQRRRLRRVRVAKDEELFRFQTRGSVRLRETGSELTGRILSIFDEDQALARGSKRIWASPGIWGALVASLLVVFSARALFFTGVPNVGFSFPFESPSVALARWFGGWNDSGLGSGTAVHPSVGLTGAVSWLWFGAEGAARTISTIALGVVGVVGMGRLAARFGLRGPGRYLSGIVLLAGPGTAVLTAAGSWLSFAAAAVAPWAVRAVFSHKRRAGIDSLAAIGAAVLLSIPLAALSPVLVLAPLVFVVTWALMGGTGGRPVLALAALAGAVAAVPFLLGDPGWLFESNRRLGGLADPAWLVLILVGVVPLFIGDLGSRLAGVLGGVVALAALAAANVIPLGPGLEEGLLILASLGTALVVAVGLERFSSDVGRLASALAAVAILGVSLASFGNGRLGLPPGDANDSLAFATTLAGDGGPGRVLLVSETRSDVPGEARPGPGFWYRVIDGKGMTHDELWLPPMQAGDRSLEDDLTAIASGAVLRPGGLLGDYAIDWIVLAGPENDLDSALDAQLDLIPVPLDPGARVFENTQAAPVADSDVGEPWIADGGGFVGNPGSGRVVLAQNYDAGWQPEPSSEGWRVGISASTGTASYQGPAIDRWLEIVSLALLAISAGLVIMGRTRR